MLTLLKDVECFSPEYRGIKDILIVKDIIYKILEPNSSASKNEMVKTINCSGLTAVPGIIDGHVHITGGGGEEGFVSRIKEIDIEDILLSGITTVVGLLGADSQTRSLKDLLAKAKALETQGISTFIYSGSYAIPIINFTEDITSDLVLIDKVIGAGEVAISDHRSSNPCLKDMLELSSKAHLGGLISGKAGLVHIHVGDGKTGLDLMNRLLNESDLPIEQFLPTHVNRNRELFEQAKFFAENGGYIDLTAGEKAGIAVPEALQDLIQNGIDLSHVTISSDANGSIPGGGAGRIQTLFDDLIQCIQKYNINPELVFSLVTKNISKRLKQYPQKGVLSEGSDADILLMDKSFHINKLFCMGKLMVDNGQILNNKWR